MTGSIGRGRTAATTQCERSQQSNQKKALDHQDRPPQPSSIFRTHGLTCEVSIGIATRIWLPGGSEVKEPKAAAATIPPRVRFAPDTIVTTTWTLWGTAK